jgi:hypothetical protein
MDDDFEELDYQELELSVRQDTLEIIDRVLLANLGRLWECLGYITPHIRRGEGWSYHPEDLRRSALGRNLLYLAASADGNGYYDKEDIERAMNRVCNMLFGNCVTDDFILPLLLDQTELGQLLNKAERCKYNFRELISAKKAYTYLKITRQSLHDRAKEGKLRRFKIDGEYQYVFADIKVWKLEREQRQNRLKS